MRDGYLGNATAHCAATDALPTRCDFVVHNQELVTPVIVLLVEFIALIVAAFNVSEMEQASLEWRLWCHRVARLTTSNSDEQGGFAQDRTRARVDESRCALHQRSLVCERHHNLPHPLR